MENPKNRYDKYVASKRNPNFHHGSNMEVTQEELSLLGLVSIVDIGEENIYLKDEAGRSFFYKY